MKKTITVPCFDHLIFAMYFVVCMYCHHCYKDKAVTNIPKIKLNFTSKFSKSR